MILNLHASLSLVAFWAFLATVATLFRCAASSLRSPASNALESSTPVTFTLNQHTCRFGSRPSPSGRVAALS